MSSDWGCLWHLEVGYLAQLGFASKLRSFAASRRYCHAAITLGDSPRWRIK
jgi:hypothetical protein